MPAWPADVESHERSGRRHPDLQHSFRRSSVNPWVRSQGVSVMSCKTHCLGIVILLALLNTANVHGQNWNPFSPKNDEDLIQPERPNSEPEAKWFSLPSWRWSEPSRRNSPTLLQQWQGATRRSMAQTKHFFTAPFEHPPSRPAETSLAPRWRGLSSSKPAAPTGWFGSDPPPDRPRSVNDFLALPRPE